MNTTEKGESFEKKVYDIIENLLKSGGFPVQGNFYQLFHKREYFSNERKSNICVDISVEFSREKELPPSFYVITECKDCSRPVPVDDVEEFYAKMQQITGANVKGMLFTRSSLQQAAFNYAQSKGIAVVRILDDDSLAWLIERTSNQLVTGVENSIGINVLNALTNEYFISTRQSTFGYVNGKAFSDVAGVMLELLDN
jgi:hypothetical protein